MVRRWGNGGSLAGQRAGPVRERPEEPAILVRLLGPIEVDGLDQSLTAQQLSLVAYLATVGPTDRQGLADALWDGQRVSAGRVANLISEVRRVLGPDHLPVASGGRYQLAGVTTDVDVLAGLSLLDPEPGDDEAIGCLERALGLVRGPVFAVSGRRFWGWLDLHPELAGRAEVVVSAVALRVASTLGAAGEYDRANLACERALTCMPLDRQLVLTLVELYRAQGRPASARRLIEGWRSGVCRIGGDDPRPSALAVH